MDQMTGFNLAAILLDRPGAPIDEYSVRGSGYEFQIMQMKFATLRISGECLVYQTVLDLPPGQLPPLK
jgi:hypothetical protein